MSSSRGVVSYGRENIEFSLFHTDRKSLEISVHPDQSVVIKAPFGTGIEEVRKRVIRRAGWIIKQRNFFRQFDPRTPQRRYVGGETHLYLGRHYRLRIGSGKHDAVKLIKGYFEIKIKGQISPEKVKGLLEGWYRDKAAWILDGSFNRCWPYFEKFCSSKPLLQIRSMRKRWGSLSSKGRLTLNIDLILAPRECINYVIVHELSHLRYNNHGPEFYRFLDKVMPDWEKRKRKLEITLA
jgi:predicted metal-dependent hydrolase